MWQADDILKAVAGIPYRIERETFVSISTDSRTIKEGELFVPLEGPTYDGHTFAAEAFRKSGGGTLCRKGRDDICRTLSGTVILVDDTTKALLDLARFRRRQIGATFVAITGSNGKTTTKEVLVRILGSLFGVVCNEKNYNNQIGVSKSILTIEGNPHYAVFELGTNHKGEIRVLAELVKPDVSLITNINASHLEGLGDLKGVLEEKLTLFELTRQGGMLFINKDDPSLASVAFGAHHTVYTYGIGGNADFTLSVEHDRGLDGFEIVLTLLGQTVNARTSLLGVHNLYNILAAASIAHSLGVPGKPLAEAVESFGPYPGRFKAIRSPKGYIVVDDTYNANPTSVAWAIQTLSGLPCNGKRIAILGDMRELGEKTEEYHRELGRLLKRSSLSKVLLLGEDVKNTFNEMNNGRALLFPEKGALIEYMTGRLHKEDIVLVKGSHALKMEEIVEALT